MWKKPQFLFLCSLLIVVLSACSSSQPSEDPMLETELGSSNADAVGSIPEDMLAADEKASDAAQEATTETPPESDPFKDLKEGEKKEEVAESSEDSNNNSGAIETYTVKPGDTLMKIAFSLYGDIDRWKEIFDLNKGSLKKASLLKSGMQLKYEAPSSAFSPDQLSHTYEIKKGDTLANIADEVYGRKMKYKKLQKYNAKLVKNPNRIFAGFTLFYDITEQEMAEAEARRKERMASSGGFESVPSAITPPPTDLTAPAPVVSSAPISNGSEPASTAPAAPEGLAPPPPPPALAPPPPPPAQ